jgi:hypothetical protein
MRLEGLKVCLMACLRLHLRGAFGGPKSVFNGLFEIAFERLKSAFNTQISVCKKKKKTEKLFGKKN